MSEFRILDVVLRLFPDVTAAVEEYNQIRSDRESRSIARSLANEEALYTQFARKIWLLSQSSSQSGRNLDQRSLDRLGAGTTDFILNGLREMEELLRNLKADLHNFSVSTVSPSFPAIPPSPRAQMTNRGAGGSGQAETKGKQSPGDPEKRSKDSFHEKIG